MLSISDLEQRRKTGAIHDTDLFSGRDARQSSNTPSLPFPITLSLPKLTLFFWHPSNFEDDNGFFSSCIDENV